MEEEAELAQLIEKTELVLRPIRKQLTQLSKSLSIDLEESLGYNEGYEEEERVKKSPPNGSKLPKGTKKQTRNALTQEQGCKSFRAVKRLGALQAMGLVESDVKRLTKEDLLKFSIGIDDELVKRAEDSLSQTMSSLLPFVVQTERTRVKLVEDLLINIAGPLFPNLVFKAQQPTCVPEHVWQVRSEFLARARAVTTLMVPLVFLLEQRLSLHDCMGQLLSMIKAADAVNLENNINVQKYFGVVTDLMNWKFVVVETSRSGYKVEESVTVFWEGWEGEKSQIDRETFSILLGWLKLANDVAAGKHQTPLTAATMPLHHRAPRKDYRDWTTAQVLDWLSAVPESKVGEFRQNLLDWAHKQQCDGFYLSKIRQEDLAQQLRGGARVRLMNLLYELNQDTSKSYAKFDKEAAALSLLAGFK